jgi:hypothetical protein
MSSGGGGGGSAPAIQTQIVREAPGIEERKIGLMDIGLNLGSTPVNIPDYQIAGQRTRNCFTTSRNRCCRNYWCRCRYSTSRDSFFTTSCWWTKY